MKKEKLQEILDSMKGITYLDWLKLRISIENCFSTQFSRQENITPLADPREIMKEYKNFDSNM